MKNKETNNEETIKIPVVNQFSFKEEKKSVEEMIINQKKSENVEEKLENDDLNKDKINNTGKKLQIKSRTKNNINDNNAYSKIVKTSGKKLIQKSDDEEDYSNHDNNLGDIFTDSNNEKNKNKKKQ